MNLPNVSRATSRSRRIRRAALLGLISVFALSLARPARAYKTTQVTGQTTDTAAGNQAETYCTSSTFGGNVIQSVAYNDNTGEAPTLIQYTPSSSPGRTVLPGFSGFGWSFRTVFLSGPGPWTHSLFQTPQSIGWDVVWGDPSIASNDGLPGFVFAGTLAIPHDKFVAISALNGTPGKIQGPLTTNPSPLGGGCVYRSKDGGQSFTIVDCVRTTTDVGTIDDNMGHFYDGSSMAVTKAPGGGTGFSVFIAFEDTETARQAVWTMTDATSNAAHPFQIDSTVVGNVGPLPGEELAEIETHVRLAASGDNLWEMSARDRPGGGQFNCTASGCTPVLSGGNLGFALADLEVNIRDRNGSTVLAAENAEVGLEVALGNDAMGNPLTFRTGPQFAMDVGLNESGNQEMRFVYVAVQVDPVSGNLTGAFLQAGFCAIDLSSCSTPSQWRTAVSPAPFVYFPAIKYGVAPVSGAPSWKVTWQQLQGQQLAVFAADLQRPDLVPGSPTFSASGLHASQETAFQTPCPDRRGDNVGNAGYWGDYDGMTYNATSGDFTRTFTDSTLGCGNRFSLTSHDVHVSEVDLVALGAPRQALATLSNISFYTTGGNVGNCGSPANTNQQGICCEDSNGNFTIACKPIVQPDGSFSTAEQHVSQQLACGDGKGAWVDVYCEGTGIVGDTTITGRIETSVSNNCGSDDKQNGTQVESFTLTADQDESLGTSVPACANPGNVCASDPCRFNQFLTDVAAANTGL